jgi:hypothetical protein
MTPILLTATARYRCACGNEACTTQGRIAASGQPVVFCEELPLGWRVSAASGAPVCFLCGVKEEREEREVRR